MPFMFPTLQSRPPVTPAEGLSTLSAVLQWLPPDDLAQFVHRFAMFLASGDKRRAGEWEYVSWADYMGEATLSAGGRRILIDFATRFAAAMRGHTASAKTIGKAAESVVYMPLTGRGTNDVLDLPTCEAWIDPWVILLRRLGVRLRLGHTVTRLHMDGGRVIGAHARGPRGPVRIEADYFVVALPVERARRLWSRPVLAADPGLARTRNLGTGWMTGLQFYLREPFPIARGALVCLDSPWSVFGISQSQFWPARDLARDYGDGEVREKFSAIICDWETPGVVYGKPARDCTDAEIAHDAFEQIKRHLQYPGAPELRDDLLHSTYLDPGIIRRDGKIVANLDPLLLNTVGHWDDRPAADTAIGNLFLAGDYVRVDFDITSMEGANEAARRAVGALLAEAGSSATPPTVFARQLPDEWAALRRVDDARYAAGQPHVLEAGLEALGRLTGSELRQRAGV
jgi:uncharacterized protein with NAD-binding domain and iron-sulfur cluster